MDQGSLANSPTFFVWWERGARLHCEGAGGARLYRSELILAPGTRGASLAVIKQML